METDQHQSPQEYNQELRSELRHLMDKIDIRSHQLRRSRVNGGVSDSGAHASNCRKELESVLERITRVKRELGKAHQMSSIRGLQDRLKETRQRLDGLNDEISAATELGIQQEEALKQTRCPNMVLVSLQQEITKEKRLHVDLRRSSAELDRTIRTEDISTVRAEIAQLTAALCI